MLLKTFESFKNEPGIRDYAWLYFLIYVYNGKLLIKDWQNDKRMGVLISESFDKLNNLVEITDEFYIAKEGAENVVLNQFYKKDMSEAFKYATELYKDYHTKDKFYGYSIEKIPIELWLKNSKINKAIDKWSDEIFTSWWNTNGNSIIANKYIKKREKLLPKINEFKLREYFFPNELPEKLTIYRGIKHEYDPNHLKTFTSWTLNKEQGLRFAKWHFIKGYSSTGKESEIQYLLEKEIDINEISIFIGGEEHEVIMLEPVKVDKITNLK